MKLTIVQDISGELGYSKGKESKYNAGQRNSHAIPDDLPASAVFPLTVSMNITITEK